MATIHRILDGVDVEYAAWPPRKFPVASPAALSAVGGPNERVTKHLAPGWRKAEGKRAVQAAFGGITLEQATWIPMRDGVRLCANIYRPASDDAKVPAIIMYTPYDRNGTGLNLNRVPYRSGVDESHVSGLEVFEGLDPVEWVARGYAIVNLDMRGDFASEGDSEGVLPSSNTGRDGYDAVEWLATQRWCNGKVGFAGNSQLAMAQMFVGAQRPPHLAALAPWEAVHDQFRHILCRGGLSNMAFCKHVVSMLHGHGLVKQPTHDEFDSAYRQAHVAKLQDVAVPLYILASYSSCIHTLGSVAMFKQAVSAQKWLRFHDEYEWHDLYTAFATEDLAKFFGKYLQGNDNGWESTPRVRHALLRAGGQPSDLTQTSDDYPAKGTQYMDLFLDGQHSMGSVAGNADGTASFDAEDPQARLYFDWVADKEYVLSGAPRLVLNVSTTGTEIDQHYLLQKIDAHGKPMEHINIPLEAAQRNYKSLESFGVKLPYPATMQQVVVRTNTVLYLGSHGCLRASHRHVDEAANWLDNNPVHSHRRDTLQPIETGKVTPFTTGLWPLGMVIAKGEGLRLWIGATQVFAPEFPDIVPDLIAQNTNNGTHTLHYGASNAPDKSLGQSRVIVPVAPFSV